MTNQLNKGAQRLRTTCLVRRCLVFSSLVSCCWLLATEASAMDVTTLSIDAARQAWSEYHLGNDSRVRASVVNVRYHGEVVRTMVRLRWRDERWYKRSGSGTAEVCMSFVVTPNRVVLIDLDYSEDNHKWPANRDLTPQIIAEFNIRLECPTYFSAAATSDETSGTLAYPDEFAPGVGADRPNRAVCDQCGKKSPTPQRGRHLLRKKAGGR